MIYLMLDLVRKQLDKGIVRKKIEKGKENGTESLKQRYVK